VTALMFVISADNLSAGVASAAFIAYLSSLTNVSYSATQYALFSSMMLLAPKWLAGYSGAFVDAYDYPTFFTATAAAGPAGAAAGLAGHAGRCRRRRRLQQRPERGLLHLAQRGARQGSTRCQRRGHL
jgi:hypothetical protein